MGENGTIELGTALVCDSQLDQSLVCDSQLDQWWKDYMAERRARRFWAAVRYLGLAAVSFTAGALVVAI